MQAPFTNHQVAVALLVKFVYISSAVPHFNDNISKEIESPTFFPTSCFQVYAAWHTHYDRCNISISGVSCLTRNCCKLNIEKIYVASL